MNVSTNFKDYYNKYFNEDSSEWTKIGAKYKVKNILNILDNKKYHKVLEVGFGDGSIIEKLVLDNRIIEIYGIDIGINGIELLKKKKDKIKKLKEVKEYDGYNIPYQDNFFDLVVCTHVIEHVEFPRLLLRDIKRVGKEFVFEIPIDFSLNVDKKLDYFINYGHINIYTPALFRFLLLQEKFLIKKDKCKLAANEVYKYLYRNKIYLYFFALIKKLIWTILPYIKKYMPNYYIIYLNKK